MKNEDDHKKKMKKNEDDLNKKNEDNLNKKSKMKTTDDLKKK